jgi:UDP-N-acetylmuramyl pentapeptide phosphotransferase/UDP-N-acetylglucosamine-1-phosphate transferase
MFDYLLPNVFKKLGLGIYISSVFFVFFATDLGINPMDRHDLILILATLGFGLIINSKERIEDERTMICRYKALGKTFRFLLIMFFITKMAELTDQNIQYRPTSFGIFAFIAVMVYYSTFERLLKDEL